MQNMVSQGHESVFPLPYGKLWWPCHCLKTTTTTVLVYIVHLCIFSMFVHVRYNVPPPTQNYSQYVQGNYSKCYSDVQWRCKAQKIVGTDKLSKGKGSHVYRVRRQQMERNATNPDQLQKSPGKKRQPGNRKVLYVYVYVCVCGQFWQLCIRNTTQDFCMYEKKVPTIPTLLPVLKRKYVVHFSWGRLSMHRAVNSLGF
jgi:hypothetical protein